MEEKKKGFDERFTDFADAVSELVSKWEFTTISFLLLIVWIAIGAFVIRGDWFTSTTWNFPLNTITTVGEWFLEGFILISTARVEKRNRQLQEQHTLLLEKINQGEQRDALIISHVEQMLEQQFTIKHVTQTLEENLGNQKK